MASGRLNRLPGILDRVRGALGLPRSSKGGAEPSAVEASQNWRAEDYQPPLVEDTAARDPWDPIAPKADQISRDLPVSQDILVDHSPAERPISQGGTSESDSHLVAATEEPATQAGTLLGAEEWQRLEDAESDAAEAAANPSADIIGGGLASTPILEPTLEVRVAPTDDHSADPDDEIDPVDMFDDVDLEATAERDPDWGALNDAEVIEARAQFDPRRDWDVAVDLPDFDPTARQDPWLVDDTSPPVVIARRKAAAIVELLEFDALAERQPTLDWLVEFFGHLQHPSTFRAIHTAALQGLTSRSLRSIVAVRLNWMERSDWWMGRYGSYGSITPLPHGASALTWVLARRICLARSDHPEESMIDEDWFDEWKGLSAGEPGFLSFPSYIAVKLSGADDELLNEGLRLKQRWSQEAEVADDWQWPRKLTNDEDGLTYGFRILTPFDDRPGQLKLTIEDS